MAGKCLAANSGDPRVVGRKRGLAARTRQPSDSVSERLSTATNVFFVLRFPRMHIYTVYGDIYVPSETDPRETTLVVGSTQSVIGDRDDVTTDTVVRS